MADQRICHLHPVHIILSQTMGVHHSVLQLGLEKNSTPPAEFAELCPLRTLRRAQSSEKLCKVTWCGVFSLEWLAHIKLERARKKQLHTRPPPGEI